MTLVDQMQNTVLNLDVKENKEVKPAERKEEKIKYAKKQPRVIVPDIGGDDSELAVKLQVGTIALCKTELEVIKVLQEADCKSFVWMSGDKPQELLPALCCYPNGVCIEVQEGGKLVTRALETYRNDPGDFKITDFNNLILEQNQQELFCRFELGNADEDTRDWEDTDAEIIENETDIYNRGIEQIEAKFGDRLEHLEYYRYTVSDLTDADVDTLIDMFEKIESELDYCYINYDFIDKEEF